MSRHFHPAEDPARLRETLPEITVETCFARLEGKDPERVVFEPV